MLPYIFSTSISRIYFFFPTQYKLLYCIFIIIRLFEQLVRTVSQFPSSLSQFHDNVFPIISAIDYITLRSRKSFVYDTINISVNSAWDTTAALFTSVFFSFSKFFALFHFQDMFDIGFCKAIFTVRRKQVHLFRS